MSEKTKRKGKQLLLGLQLRRVLVRFLKSQARVTQGSNRC